MNNTKQKFPVKIFILAMLVGAVSCSFTSNTTGLFYVPASEALGLSRTTFSLYYSWQALATFITLMFAGKFLANHREKFSMIVILCGIGTLLSYFLYSRANSMVLFYVGATLLGVCNAFDTSLLYSLLLNNWFAKKTNFFFGLATALTSLTATFFSPKLSVLVASNYRNAYLLIGAVVAVITVIVGLFAKYSPDMVGLKPWGAEENEAQSEKKENVLTGVKFEDAKKSGSIVLGCATIFCGASLGFYTFAIPGYVGSLGYDAVVIGVVSSCYLVGGLVSRLLAGYLTDVIGVMKSLIICVAIGIIGILVLIFGAASGVAMVYVGSVLFGFGMCYSSCIPSIMTRDLYGSKDYAKIFSPISSMIWLGTMIMIPIYNAIYDLFGTYVPGMWLVIALLLISLVLLKINMAKVAKLAKD